VDLSVHQVQSIIKGKKNKKNLVHTQQWGSLYYLHISENELVTKYMRGSQKVPGNVVKHCSGRTYDNAYLIIFKVEPLHTHTHTYTHLLHRPCHC
jgi:hypothetical protein